MQKMPISKELLSHLNNWYKIELTYSSCELENNALSRADAALAIEKELASGGKKIADHLEVIANAQAWEMVRDLAARKTADQVDTHAIVEIYKLLSPTSPDIQKLNSILEKRKSATGLSDLIKAINTHCNIIIAKPFISQNGQMARLLLNMYLMQAGFTPAIIEPRAKDRYMAALAKYTTDPEEMLQIVFAAISKSLDIFIKTADLGVSALSHTSKRPIKVVKSDGPLKIGELAGAVGETVPTIRFWTKEGLLTVSQYTNSGYQLYDHSAIERAEQIRQLQNEQRLSIKELKAKLVSSG
jgi:hypothetical protein